MDELAQELIKTKNEKELKKVLFHQLLLLEQNKKNESKLSQFNLRMNTLEKDKNDLLKCENVVIRALNKKKYTNHSLNTEIRELELQIEKVTHEIQYYESYGDFYLNKLKNV